MSLYALGGGQLIGDRLMRFVYLDESGLNKADKYIVVAGAIVNADKHWKAIEEYLFRLMNLVVPPQQSKGFFFHAKRLHNGRAWEPREPYPHSVQRGILHKLCEIPQRFGLPVVVGYTDRSALNALVPSREPHDLTVTGQAVAASMCAGHVEVYMRAEADPEEVATLVYEDNASARRLIKMMHNIFRDRVVSDEAEAFFGDMSGILPFERVVDTAHFAAKSDTSLLQVADACAFATRRHITGMDKDGYFTPIAPLMLRYPEVFGDDYDSVFSSEGSF